MRRPDLPLGVKCRQRSRSRVQLRLTGWKPALRTSRWSVRSVVWTVVGTYAALGLRETDDVVGSDNY